ncbi:MAG TPA: hypothetical protein VMF89_19230, partial [Polyangiales bacterium]|nr:hypothetical protein [Polyangiales bacterium]
MALNRRDFLACLPLGLLGCSGSEQRRVQSSYAEIARTTPSGELKGTVLVAMPETAQTKEVWTGLNDELGKECSLVAIRAEGDGIAAAIERGVKTHKPSGIVLMNNPTVAAYRAVQRKHSVAQFPAAVIVMTSFLDGHPQQLSAAT